MTDTNIITLVGRLTRDVGNDERDFGYLQNGTCYAKISIAVNESKKGQDGNWQDYANYFEVHVYGKTAENLKPYLTKGQQICVTGTLHQDRRQDKQTGNNQSRVVIKSSSIQLLGGKRDGQQNGAPRFQPVNNQNRFHNQPQNVPRNNQQGGFNGTTANGDYENYGSNFPENIPF